MGKTYKETNWEFVDRIDQRERRRSRPSRNKKREQRNLRNLGWEHLDDDEMYDDEY